MLETQLRRQNLLSSSDYGLWRTYYGTNEGEPHDLRGQFDTWAYNNGRDMDLEPKKHVTLPRLTTSNQKTLTSNIFLHSNERDRKRLSGPPSLTDSYFSTSESKPSRAGRRPTLLKCRHNRPFRSQTSWPSSYNIRADRSNGFRTAINM